MRAVISFARFQKNDSAATTEREWKYSTAFDFDARNQGKSHFVQFLEAFSEHLRVVQYEIAFRPGISPSHENTQYRFRRTA